MSEKVNKENKENKENKGIKKVFVTGVLTKMRYEKGYKGKGNEAWRISVKPDIPITSEIKKEILQIMNIDVDNVFCPKWLKDGQAEYINVHTIFDIPCRIIGNNGVWYDITMNEIYEGATVKIGLKVKEGGIYPYAMQVEKNGVPYNPFEDFGGEE